MDLNNKKTIQKIKNGDKDEHIASFEFSGWIIWPLIRYYLLIFFSNNGSKNLKQKKIKKIYFSILEFFYSLFHNFFIFKSKKKYKHVFFYDRRHLQNNMNTLYGEFFQKESIREESLFVDYNIDCFSRKKLMKSTYSYSPILYLTYFISSILSMSPRLRYRIKNIICKLNLDISEKEKNYLIKKMTFFVYFFSVTKFFFKKFLKKNNIQALVLSNFNGKLGEVAASHEAGVRVLELQHGIFGPNDLDYSLSHHIKHLKKKIPLPSKILTYGDIWKECLLKEGFWDDADIGIVGSGVISYYKKKLLKKIKKNYILLVDQPNLIEVSEKFIFNLVNLLEKKNKNLKFVIKLHQLNSKKIDYYYKLFEKLDKKIIFYENFCNIYEILLKSKLVLGYYSTVLFESSMLDIPTLSINLSSEDTSIDRIVNISELKNLIPTISTPEEVIFYMDKYNFLKDKSKFLKEDFQKNLQNIIYQSTGQKTKLKPSN